MKVRKILSLLLAMVIASSFLAGCGEKTVESALPYAINEMYKDVDVIDDLPDWTGEKLDLKLWWGQGNNHSAIGKTKKEDKFQEEFARVTGITLNEKESFDNSGVSVDAKIARVVAANTYPHIATDMGGEILQQLIDNDLVYDLTEYIPKYMPNFMSYINSSEDLRYFYDRKMADNGKYSFKHLSVNAFEFTDPEFSPEKYKGVITESATCPFVYVRDDILKAIHPEAHTVKELQDIYMQNGTFTAEEVADFTINSLDEFRTFLEDIKALGVKEYGREVWPFYTFDGMDNWSLFASGAFFAGTGFNSPNSYFIYYDAKDDKLKNPAKEDWYKEYVKFFNQLYRDGLASEEALIDNKAAFDQKVANGEYAIIYGLNAPPTQDALEAAGKDYAYRKVFVDIPTDTSRFGNAKSIDVWSYHHSGLTFFKNMLTEAQLEQVLRAIDFGYTDAGMKFAQWGPEKSGLYEVKEDGSFMFTDEAVEQAIAYEGDKQVLYDNGYESFPPISVLTGGNRECFNKYHYGFVYQPIKDAQRSPINYTSEFKYTHVKPAEDLPRLEFLWFIYSLVPYSEGTAQMWSARQGAEDAFTHILAAKSDEEFEQAWAEYGAYLERNGFTDETLEEVNKVFVEKNGGDISKLADLG